MPSPGFPRTSCKPLSAASSRSELVFQRGTPPEAVYSFKHALVQDAAHDSLLRSSRQQLHAQIAEALETQSPELMDSQPELFAQHYAEAGKAEKSRSSLAEGGSTCSPTMGQYRSDRPFDQWDRRAHGTIREHPACVVRAQTAARPRPDAVGDTWLELPRGRTGLSPSRAISAGTWRRPGAIRRVWGLWMIDKTGDAPDVARGITSSFFRSQIS